MSSGTPSAPPLPATRTSPTWPLTVVGPHFTVANPMELIMKSVSFSFLDHGSFLVTDVNGNEVLKVKGSSAFTFVPTRRTLLDNAGNPIVTLRPKTISAHRKWNVYKGESTDANDHLFTAQKSSLFQFKTKIDVFLSGNTTQEVPDFTVNLSRSDKSCTIFLGNTDTIIAQMHKKESFKTMIKGKTKYSLTVYPNVDFAFIVALLVATHEISSSSDTSSHDTSAGTGGGAGGLGGGAGD